MAKQVSWEELVRIARKSLRDACPKDALNEEATSLAYALQETIQVRVDDVRATYDLAGPVSH